ncbi:MAG: hypothetical protein QFX33_04065 [Candidatus Nezhaarchaeota archaeon]|nr:hypothetical protein [Candidatus Nezhaarchaeota archaeon]
MSALKAAPVMAGSVGLAFVELLGWGALGEAAQDIPRNLEGALKR